MHSIYMTIISALFAGVSALLIISLIRHHKACKPAGTRFAGPTGSVQLLWALVPVAILGYVDYALFNFPAERTAALPKKIELAANQGMAPSLPALPAGKQQAGLSPAPLDIRVLP